MAMMEKLINVSIATIVYFSIFASTVTAIQLTNWTALELTWVPTILYILLAITPVVALILVFKKK